MSWSIKEEVNEVNIILQCAPYARETQSDMALINISWHKKAMEDT